MPTYSDAFARVMMARTSSISSAARVARPADVAATVPMPRQSGGESVSDRRLAIVWMGGGTKPSSEDEEVDAPPLRRDLLMAKGEEVSESAEAERPLVCMTSGGGRSPEERIRMRSGRPGTAIKALGKASLRRLVATRRRS